MSLHLVDAPSTEPITATEAKAQVRVDASTEDDWFTRVIQSVRERGEATTGRSFITQTWKEILDVFPCESYIEVPKPPLVSVTHVKYRDTNGDLQTWDSANYIVEAPAGPRCARGRISLAYNVSWPSTYGQAGDVEVQFVCGYGAAEDVPALLKQAMLLDLGTLYATRESVVVGTVMAELPLGLRDMYRPYISHSTRRRAA